MQLAMNRTKTIAAVHNFDSRGRLLWMCLQTNQFVDGRRCGKWSQKTDLYLPAFALVISAAK